MQFNFNVNVQGTQTNFNVQVEADDLAEAVDLAKIQLLKSAKDSAKTITSILPKPTPPQES